MYSNESKVLLPRWIWERAQDTKHFKQLVLEYIEPRYPGYVVKKVKGRFAVCEIPR